LLGLAEAHGRFDPARGVEFGAYAIARVKGAMVDAIRAADWVPRKTRARERRINEVRDRLTSTLGRAPSPSELARELGDDVKGLDRPAANLLALEQLEDAGATAPAADQADPADIVVQSELEGSLPQAMEQLGERERVVLELHYYRGMTLSQIAGVLGVTESRVSQLHLRALRSMRQRMDVA
ncbi:MAG: sigma-70 family RNA polymerase sigma factor, partial [Actinomycetota bacterium]|nr:sigma-70 family RNA polymerase sigma factor [Actinomycetota bacterium]